MNNKCLFSLLLFALLGTQPSSAQGFLKKLSKAINSATEIANKVVGSDTTSDTAAKTTESKTTSQTGNNAKFSDFFASNIENTYQIDNRAVVEIALTNKMDYPLLDVNDQMIYMPGQPQKYIVTINNPDCNTKVQGKLNVLLYRQDLPNYLNFTTDSFFSQENRQDKPLYKNSQGVSFEAEVEQKPDAENLVWCNRKDLAVSDCYIHSIKGYPYFHCKLKNLRSTPIKFYQSSADRITAYDAEGSCYDDAMGITTYINRCSAFPSTLDEYFGSVLLEPNSSMDYDVCLSPTSEFSKGEYTYLRLFLLDDYAIYCTNLKFK